MAASDVGERATGRLLLRRLQPADHAELAAMHREPRVMATLGGAWTDEQSRAFLDRALAHWVRHGFGWWALRDRATGRFLGRGGLRLVELEGCEELELGYGLLPDCWGRGLATELALESVRIASDQLGRDAVVSLTLPANRASQRAMEKAGLRYERPVEYAGLPHVPYRLRRTEWLRSPRVPRT